MKALVAYASTTGNTRKVAEAMARALGCEARAVGELDAAGVEAERIFVGGAVYATHDHGLDPALTGFIARLEPRKIGTAYAFSTGFERSDASGLVARALAARGVAVGRERFACKGQLFKLFMRGHPDARDLEAAAAFALRASGQA